jgi:CheY-like chemotaxis protein
MTGSASKQGHHPYRRGERRRKPFATEQTVPPTQAGALFQRASPSPPIRGVVLLVESEAPLRWHLGNALAERGYSVAEAVTAAQAIALLEQMTFDLLLLDLDLLDETSWTLLRSLAVAESLAPPLILLPARPRAAEQTDIAPPGTMLPEPSWVADLMRLAKRIRSAPGPPGSAGTET